MINNQKGSVIITSALIMAVLAGVVYFYSNVQMLNVTKQYRKTKSMAYAHQIAGSFAQSLRRAYDVAQVIAKDPTNTDKQALCTGFGLGLHTIGGVSLCLKNRGVCMPHPGNAQRQLCISLDDNSLYAKQNQTPSHDVPQFASLMQWLLSPQKAFAQPYRPPVPPSLETNNDLPDQPRCLGGACSVICQPNPGANADCVTFRFCPIMSQVGECEPDEVVTQTVGFLRD